MCFGILNKRSTAISIILELYIDIKILVFVPYKKIYVYIYIYILRPYARMRVGPFILNEHRGSG